VHRWDPDASEHPNIVVVKIRFQLSGAILLQPLMPPFSFPEHYYDKGIKLIAMVDARLIRNARMQGTRNSEERGVCAVRRSEAG
jgi:hypothetical protein